MRITFCVIAFWLACSMGAWAAPCELKDPQTLVLQGEIKKDLPDCVRALDISAVNTVIVNSGGGNVEAAMTVGDMIAPLRPHIIIKKNCHSSCANYWLPLARKITFKKKARILLHGSMDEGIYNKYQKNSDKDWSFIKGLIFQQDDYARRHGIPRGWLLYRTDYSLGTDAFAPYITGDFSKVHKTKTIKLWMVAEPLLKSCLPNVEIDGYANSYAANRTDKQWKKLAKKGTLLTGSWVCNT